MQMQEMMAAAFLERQLKQLAEWRAHQARWNFVGHHRRNPARAAWKKRRAAGRV